MLEALTSRDSLTLEGARILALRIEDYWRTRGYFAIEARIEHDGWRHKKPFFGVRSNIGPDGYPPSNLQ